MSRMKHLLRKLHIGGSVNDQHRVQDGRLTLSSTPPSSPSPSSPSVVGASGTTRGGDGAAAETQRAGGDAAADFSFFEEEFQVQLALAMSVSDPDGREDPESAQIKAAKRISLGCSTASAANENPVDFLSLRYWNYNVVDYDEKVDDGFYDVYGIISDANMSRKMPSLVDLEAISVSTNVDCEVVLVNRMVDYSLQQLEKKAISFALECRAVDCDPIASGLVCKIADLVVGSMGGAVGNADDMLRCWMEKSYELRTSLNTIIFPLGCLDIGLSRHRALLFKVLADRIDLPCRLVKGSYYTGTDEGAVNLIKVAPDSEYIIDLMGAPGTLIPAEIFCHVQNSELRATSSSNIEQIGDLHLASVVKANQQLEASDKIDGSSSYSGSDLRLVNLGLEETLKADFVKDDVHLSEKNRTEKFEHEFGMLLHSLDGLNIGGSTGSREADSPVAKEMKIKDVSKYVISAAQNPKFARKLHAVLRESGASPPLDLFTNMNPSPDVKEPEAMVHDHLLPNFDFDEHSAESMKNHWKDASLSDHSYKIEKSIPSSCTNKLGLSSMDLHFPFGTDASKALVPLNSANASDRFMIQQLQNDSFAALDNIPAFNSSSMLPSTKQEVKDQEPLIPCFSDPRRMQNTFDVAGHCSKLESGITEQLETRLGGFWKESVTESVETLLERVHADSLIPISSSEAGDSMLDDVSELEIPWEDLHVGERIGIGSYGEVYRGEWNGTEVAVKKFLDQDLSGDALEQFRCEIKIMRRLRHPNVVLLMGAVTRPPNLSILTEFLPRGSLYRLLHRPNIQLDEKRRLRMALDVAKGMNYLHTSHPTIVHRDLKSSNLLVDKNWVVKVCDFGLSRLKHHTFLSSKSTAGTPEWMAPEVLRNEPSNEKCDVYSFGVILWELATLRMPWSGLNPMQVVGAVGFQDKRLSIPTEVDPTVAEIIYNCWQKEPNLRPSFAQLISPLKNLKRLVIEVP